MSASWTPWVPSSTSSRSGNRVARMRRRRSSRSACGKSIRYGRIEGFPAASAEAVAAIGASPAPIATMAAPADAEAASSWRRVGRLENWVMTLLLKEWRSDRVVAQSESADRRNLDPVAGLAPLDLGGGYALV